MKKVVAYRFVIRVLSAVTVLALVVLRLAAGPAPVWYSATGDAFLAGCVLLLLYPLKGENNRYAALQAGLFAVLMTLGECLPAFRTFLWTAILPLLLLAVFWERRRIAPRLVTKENRFFYAFLVMILYRWGHGLPLVPLYLLLYILSYNGSMFCLSAFLGRFRRRSESGKCDPAQMKYLFERAQRYLNSEQPFLDANYREDEMAKALFTNRVYLSQTINQVSGMNFKTLINSYRVRYAMTLMREQPALNIKEIALHSGFNSSNVFLTSFRQITGENPQKYLSKMREQGP